MRCTSADHFRAIFGLMMSTTTSLACCSNSVFHWSRMPAGTTMRHGCLGHRRAWCQRWDTTRLFSTPSPLLCCRHLEIHLAKFAGFTIETPKVPGRKGPLMCPQTTPRLGFFWGEPTLHRLRRGIRQLTVSSATPPSQPAPDRWLPSSSPLRMDCTPGHL